ncbi:hypothetical protein TNCV_2985821 [Trichonephila clavipes]|nr:hypothetical protein TNCV_2985821 [Trichonephila clavipes]
MRFNYFRNCLSTQDVSRSESISTTVFKDFPEVINSIVVVNIPKPTDISLWKPPLDGAINERAVDSLVVKASDFRLEGLDGKQKWGKSWLTDSYERSLLGYGPKRDPVWPGPF